MLFKNIKSLFFVFFWIVSLVRSLLYWKICKTLKEEEYNYTFILFIQLFMLISVEEGTMS